MTLLDDARALGPLLRSYSDEAESLRRLPRGVVQVLAEGGFFKLGLPEQYGGAELDPVTFVQVIDELARHDAAAAWCSMIASTTAPMAAYLPEADADEIYGGDPLTVTGGALAPSGVGRSTGGGIRRLGSVAVGERHAALPVDLRRHDRRRRRLPARVLSGGRRRDPRHLALVGTARHGIDRLHGARAVRTGG